MEEFLYLVTKKWGLSALPGSGSMFFMARATRRDKKPVRQSDADERNARVCMKLENT